MNTQLRAFLILLGAALVTATYTFPTWQPYLSMLPGRGETNILGLRADVAEQLQERVPPEQINGLRNLAREDLSLAQEIAMAELRPDQTANDDVPSELGQLLPQLSDVAPLDADAALYGPAVHASGTLTIYELADGRYILRFDELDITNLPEMNLYLSGNPRPTNQEELQQNGFYHRLRALQGNVGNYNYEVAAELDLFSYNSVVIYSEPLGVIVGYAPLN